MTTSLMRVFRGVFPVSVILLAAAAPGRAQTCSFPVTTEWKRVEVLKGMSAPSHMAIVPDGQVFVIGTVPTNRGWEVEDGMQGIVAVNAQRTSPNSNDLRGKCLRINPIPFPDSQTPTAGVGATYTIPAGRLDAKCLKK